MPTANPALNDRIFEREIQSSRGGTAVDEAGWATPTVGVPPAPDTVSPWAPAGPSGPPPGSVGTDAGVMRRGGVVSATSVLLIVLVVASWFG